MNVLLNKHSFLRRFRQYDSRAFAARQKALERRQKALARLLVRHFQAGNPVIECCFGRETYRFPGAGSSALHNRESLADMLANRAFGFCSELTFLFVARTRSYGHTRTRFVVTHVNKDGMRTISGPNQGRGFSDTPEAAALRLAAHLKNNTDALLNSVWGPDFRGTAEVRPVECYENGDAIGIYFDTEGALARALAAVAVSGYAAEADAVAAAQTDSLPWAPWVLRHHPEYAAPAPTNQRAMGSSLRDSFTDDEQKALGREQEKMQDYAPCASSFAQAAR